MGVFKKIGGVILLFIGFVALVTPFTPGSVFFLVLGFSLLGHELAVSESHWFAKWAKRIGIKIKKNLPPEL